MIYTLRVSGFDPASSSGLVKVWEARFPSYRKAREAVRSHTFGIDMRQFPVYVWAIYGWSRGKIRELKHGPFQR